VSEVLLDDAAAGAVTAFFQACGDQREGEVATSSGSTGVSLVLYYRLGDNEDPAKRGVVVVDPASKRLLNFVEKPSKDSLPYVVLVPQSLSFWYSPGTTTMPVLTRTATEMGMEIILLVEVFIKIMLC
jgi:hypothetical protein